MSRIIPAIFDAGVFKPLVPVDLNDGTRVEIGIPESPKNTANPPDVGAQIRSSSNDGEDWIDHDAHQWAEREGDPSIPLEDVRQRLSKIKDSLADLIISERGER